MTQQPATDQGGATKGGSVDMQVNERWRRNKGHEEEMEVAEAMATTKEDAVGEGTVANRWEDEDDKTRKGTTWDKKSWGCQWTMGSGATRGRGGK
jgi:hypothetical protein